VNRGRSQNNASTTLFHEYRTLDGAGVEGFFFSVTGSSGKKRPKNPKE
jgi:hypothetical protein